MPVFVEIKLSSEKIRDAIQQQNFNLQLFRDWIKGDMEGQFFKNDKINKDLKKLLESRKDVEVYLVVITNGEVSQTPTKEGLKAVLTYKHTDEFVQR